MSSCLPRSALSLSSRLWSDWSPLSVFRFSIPSNLSNSVFRSVHLREAICRVLVIVEVPELEVSLYHLFHKGESAAQPRVRWGMYRLKWMALELSRYSGIVLSSFIIFRPIVSFFSQTFLHCGVKSTEFCCCRWWRNNRLLSGSACHDRVSALLSSWIHNFPLIFYYRSPGVLHPQIPLRLCYGLEL
jgi:hypothetical protein